MGFTLSDMKYEGNQIGVIIVIGEGFHLHSSVLSTQFLLPYAPSESWQHQLWIRKSYLKIGEWPSLFHLVGPQVIYDRPPPNSAVARFTAAQAGGGANAAAAASGNTIPTSQLNPHPSSSSSTSLSSHSSSSSIMYAPKSAITNMYTGRMGQSTFQEQVVARQKVSVVCSKD